MVCVNISRWNPKRSLIEGSTTDTCVLCGDQVYVSPAGAKRIVEEGNIEIVCMKCWAEIPDVIPDSIKPSNEEQMQELEKILGYRPSAAKHKLIALLWRKLEREKNTKE